MLEQRVRENVSSVRVGILGLGYVGLPLAVRLAETGFQVMGLDINGDVVNQLRRGKSTVEGLTNKRLESVLDNRLKLESLPEDPYALTAPADELLAIDIFIICVPTPLRSRHGWDPDLRFIEKAKEILCQLCNAERAQGRLPAERLIVLESTTYPGTTREIFPPLLTEFNSAASGALRIRRSEPIPDGLSTSNRFLA